MSFNLLKTLIQSYGYRQAKQDCFSNRKGSEIHFSNDQIVINNELTFTKEFKLFDKENNLIYEAPSQKEFYLTIIELISQ